MAETVFSFVIETTLSGCIKARKSWTIRNDGEGVSPVIGTILMVSITIVLVAVLFVMIVGLGGNPHTPAVLVLSKGSVQYGYKMTLTDPTSEVVWGDVMVQLSDENQTIAWTNLSTENLVSSSSPTTWHYGPATTLGVLHVFLNVTDLAANGKINQGDSITFTTYSDQTFDTSATYIVTLVYTPTGGSMLSGNLILK